LIRIFLGNVGSGKTACAVREMILYPNDYTTYSNIKIKGAKNCKLITRDMIIKTDVIGQKKNGENITKDVFNEDFWREASKEESINVVIDEAHTILNARNSMSKKTRCLLDFLAMIRRIVQNNVKGTYGSLTLISQLERRLDVVAKEMSSQVRYHICHYTKTCKKCELTWQENNEESEPLYECPRCHWGHIVKYNHQIEVWFFNSMDNFYLWKYRGSKTHYKHIMITDIEDYFKFYNTLQWEDMIS